MLKVIFMDFYGTAAHELGPIAVDVVKKVYKSGNVNSMEEVTMYWWKTFRERLAQANGEHFQTQHQVALDNFSHLVQHFHSSEDPVALLSQMEEHWRTTAIYEDVENFMKDIQLPVYFVTNSDDDYVYANISKHHLHPAGVITSEQAKYSKPRKEIFLYALEQTGTKPEEVVHIGDSLESDVKCPGLVGIKSIWLNREKKEVSAGVKNAENLLEAAKYLKEMERM